MNINIYDEEGYPITTEISINEQLLLTEDDGGCIIEPDFYDWKLTQTNDIWHKTYFQDHALKIHQAKGFCQEYWFIMEHLKRHYSAEPLTDTIFDPMCGIGTTMIIANLHGFKSFGNELEDKYCRAMIGYSENCSIKVPDDLFADINPLVIYKGNITGYLEKMGRPVNSIGIINKNAQYLKKEDIAPFYDNKGKLIIVTSPPYTRITEHDQDQIDSLPTEAKRIGHKPMGYEKKSNIALLDPDEYKDAMYKVCRALIELEPDIIVMVTRNFIYKGKVWKLDEFVQRAITERRVYTFDIHTGYKLIEIKRTKIPTSWFINRNYESVHKAKGLPKIDWEDSQFFVKETKK